MIISIRRRVDFNMRWLRLYGYKDNVKLHTECFTKMRNTYTTFY